MISYLDFKKNCINKKEDVYIEVGDRPDLGLYSELCTKTKKPCTRVRLPLYYKELGYTDHT
jgi:hypothetical protein